MAQLVQERPQTAIDPAAGYLFTAGTADNGIARSAVIGWVEIEVNVIGLRGPRNELDNAGESSVELLEGRAEICSARGSDVGNFRNAQTIFRPEILGVSNAH